MRWVLMCLVCLQFQSCVATVYRWRDLPAQEEDLKRYSRSEKIAYYKKFGIKELDSFEITTFAEPDKAYPKESFSFLLYNRVPDADEYFKAAGQADVVAALVSTIPLTITLVYALYRLDEYAGLVDDGASLSSVNQHFNETFWFYIAGVILSSGVLVNAFSWSYEQKQVEYDAIRTKYNRSLLTSLDLKWSLSDAPGDKRLNLKEAVK